MWDRGQGDILTDLNEKKVKDKGHRQKLGLRTDRWEDSEIQETKRKRGGTRRGGVLSTERENRKNTQADSAKLSRKRKGKTA